MSGPVLELRSSSVDATRRLGEVVAGLLRGGELVLLVGELGTGKTAFTQGVARALGVVEPVTSPTFTLVHEYDGRLPVHHVDVYRLERFGEFADLAIGEMLDDEGVTLIEWGDVVASALPADYLEVRLAYGEADDERQVMLRAVGPMWAHRWEDLRKAVGGLRC
jgi:tRNA threonylcarbamoyladenosine biosynthesis protein TsaE